MKWLFLFFLSSLFSVENILQDRLKTAKSGDFLVLESNQVVTLINIRSHDTSSLILEEITLLRGNRRELPPSWPDWVRAKAPGHSSWSMLEIDLHTHQIIECYSFSKAAWIQLTPNESLFARLLNLPLKPIPATERRRIGPAPSSGEMDLRKIWQPPLVHEGVSIPNPRFEAYTAEWPQDGTELAGKTITLYFDQNLSFPLPLFISVDAAAGSLVLHALDSGHHLPSPYRYLPRRIPQFLGSTKKTEHTLLLTVKSPPYFHSFDLFAVDMTPPEKKIFPVEHILASQEGELLTLEILDTDLELLEPGHQYTWLLVPLGHNECYTETSKPFTWNP